MKLPKLYKLTSTGKTQFWEIETVGSTIIERWGQVGGKIQETSDTIKKGKNLSKKNETTPQEQAELEAKSKWEGKLTKRGYVENMQRAEAGETDHEGGVFPMLAHKFSEQGHKIVYPAYAQPKLDGHRCIVDKKCRLWSRTRKRINSCPHIEVAAKGLKVFEILDGELYNHDYHDKFEEITHLIRSSTPAIGYKNVQYHVYDAALPNLTFQQRYEWLKKNIKVTKTDPIKLVETIKVNSEEELMEAFEHFLSEGYEGAIVRNANGLYVNKRSYDLLKIKTFEDAEFKIVGMEEGRGKLQGHAGAFLCQTKSGDTFKAKMKGEHAELKRFFENTKLWNGKMLTVQYQGLSNYGIPRFPIGLRIRKD